MKGSVCWFYVTDIAMYGIDDGNDKDKRYYVMFNADGGPELMSYASSIEELVESSDACASVEDIKKAYDTYKRTGRYVCEM